MRICPRCGKPKKLIVRSLKREAMICDECGMVEKLSRCSTMEWFIDILK